MNIQKINELNDLKKQQSLLETLMTKTNEIKTKQKFEIEYGCRVRYKNFDGTYGLGRVRRVETINQIRIWRDGFVNDILFDKNDLENLSIDLYGELEKQKWFLENQISRLKTEIDSNNFEQFEFNISEEKEMFVVEILAISDIKFTSAKLFTYRKEDSNKIEKIVSNSAILKSIKEGLYLMKFDYGVLNAINQINS